jgi:hypothetical protein
MAGDSATDLPLRGVELAEEESGEGVVRDKEGVRVRARGLRKEMFRNLLNGDGCDILRCKHDD